MVINESIESGFRRIFRSSMKCSWHLLVRHIAGNRVFVMLAKADSHLLTVDYFLVVHVS